MPSPWKRENRTSDDSEEKMEKRRNGESVRRAREEAVEDGRWER
jgi:hypothetical protein